MPDNPTLLAPRKRGRPRRDTAARAQTVPMKKAPLEDDELIADFARYSEKVLTREEIVAKHRLEQDDLERLGADAEFVRLVMLKAIQRARDGSTKRELAQLHVRAAPAVANEIMMNANASPKHRIDAGKALDALATGGGENAPAAGEIFQITINLGADTETYTKPIKPIRPITFDADGNELPSRPAIAAKEE